MWSLAYCKYLMMLGVLADYAWNTKTLEKEEMCMTTRGLERRVGYASGDAMMTPASLPRNPDSRRYPHPPRPRMRI